jgi:hypothetical protein
LSERLDFLKQFGFLSLHFLLLAFNCAHGTVNLSLVLFGQFFGVNLRSFVSHFSLSL